MTNDIEEVKRRADIVDLVGSYVALKKAGKDYKALCPFHKEKTPSMFVSPEKQIFKCFGCGKGGDVFDFVTEIEGLEFGDALKLLADRTGVELTPRTRVDREAPGLKSRLFAINRLSALFYHKILLEHPSAEAARNYLRGRGVIATSIKNFMIGYAPSQGPLTTFLTRKGFTSFEIEQAGRPDRFSRRITFPLFDVVGNVVGFSGRVLDSADQPKYLNTPETAIFRKSRLIYGLNLAKKAIKDANVTVVTEGQMDVVMSHQAGVTNTVATSGTSLTDEHLTTLYRYTPNIALAFDTDAAGERAAERAILMALAHGFTVRLILLTEKDPADLVKSNPDDWRKKTEASKEALSFIIDRAMGKFPHPSAEQKKSIAREVLPYLAALSDPIEQESWVKTLAGKLAVSEKTIYLALSKLPSKETIYVERPLARGQHKTILTPAETLVALILAYPEKADRVAKEFDAKLLESNAIAQIFQTVQKNWPSIKKEPKKISSILAKSLAPDLVKQVDYLVFTVTREFPDSGEVGGELAQLVEQVGGKKSEELKREFAAKIAAAESSGNREDVKKLIQEFQKLISK